MEGDMLWNSSRGEEGGGGGLVHGRKEADSKEEESDERREWSGGWRRAVISAGLRPHLVTRQKAFHSSSLLAACPAPDTHQTHDMHWCPTQFKPALDFRMKSSFYISPNNNIRLHLCLHHIYTTNSPDIQINHCCCVVFPTPSLNIKVWNSEMSTVELFTLPLPRKPSHEHLVW